MPPPTSTTSATPRILIDVNVLMDIIEHRAGWAESFAVGNLAQAGQIEGFVSALTPIIIYWLRRRRRRSEADARTDAQDAITGLTVVPVDATVLTQAFTSALPDFEDNIQAYCVAACQADYIVTRNVSHFVGAPVPAVTPDDLLALALPATP